VCGSERRARQKKAKRLPCELEGGGSYSPSYLKGEEKADVGPKGPFPVHRVRAKGAQTPSPSGSVGEGKGSVTPYPSARDRFGKEEGAQLAFEAETSSPCNSQTRKKKKGMGKKSLHLRLRKKKGEQKGRSDIVGR